MSVMTVRAQPVPHIGRPLVHRRAPSAPLAKQSPTPGLIFLNTPTKRSSTPKSKRSPATSVAATKPTTTTSLKPSPEIADKRVSASPRGRRDQTKKDRPATRRSSSSHSTVNGGRRGVRQPSPPIELPSQAEDSFSSKLLDPFTDTKPLRLSKPSGRIALSRQPAHGLPTPPPSSPVNIPMAPKMPLSRQDGARSAPIPSNLPARKLKTGSKVLFPVCDDRDEDDSDVEAVSVPTTPTKATTMAFPSPKTAPLGQSFLPTPSPSPKAARARPVRDDNDALFALLNEGPKEGETFNDLKRVAADLAVRRQTPIPGRKLGDFVVGYYASPSFQNSPHALDLPPPMF